MGYSTAELSDGLEFLGSSQLLLNLTQRVLGRFAFGNVTGDFGESDHISGFIQNPIDDNRSPKLRAVLADAPALRFEPPMLRGLRERATRNVGCKVLGRVNQTERFADNLFGSVPLDALSTGIPGRNVSRDIKLKNGVVDDRLDKLPWSLVREASRLAMTWVSLAPMATCAT